jgi:hypothetical protein
MWEYTLEEFFEFYYTRSLIRLLLFVWYFIENFLDFIFYFSYSYIKTFILKEIKDDFEYLYVL